MREWEGFAKPPGSLPNTSGWHSHPLRRWTGKGLPATTRAAVRGKRQRAGAGYWEGFTETVSTANEGRSYPQWKRTLMGAFGEYRGNQ
jgi:hypothetical protein